jgi:hypothetical protein
MAFDRRAFLRVLGGGATLAVASKTVDAKGEVAPKAAPIKDADIPTTATPNAWIQRYAIDPDAPRLKPPIDVFDIVDSRLGFPHPAMFDSKNDSIIGRRLEINQAHHAYQAAAHAMKMGWNDDVVTAAFLHDLGKAVSYEKHCWFSAEMMKAYVSEKIYWITKVHFDIGYAMYPDVNKIPKKARFLFTDNNKDRIGVDPAAMKKNAWYIDGTHVREADDAGRTPHKNPTDIVPELKKILAKTFKLSKKGLGYDGAHADELWKLMIEPGWLS